MWYENQSHLLIEVKVGKYLWLLHVLVTKLVHNNISITQDLGFTLVNRKYYIPQHIYDSYCYGRVQYI